jgi:hypothetical protein
MGDPGHAMTDAAGVRDERRQEPQSHEGACDKSRALAPKACEAATLALNWANTIGNSIDVCRTMHAVWGVDGAETVAGDAFIRVDLF